MTLPDRAGYGEYKNNHLTNMGGQDLCSRNFGGAKIPMDGAILRMRIKRDKRLALWL